MINFLKKKNLELEFITNTDYSLAYEVLPVKRASRFIPDWFKKVPKSSITTNVENFNHPEYVYNKTVRGCIGIQNLLTTGIIVPWWSDLQISANAEGYRYKFADTKSAIDHHGNEQAPGFFEDYHFLKVKTPWILRSSKPIKYVMMSQFYSDDRSEIITMPGIGETLTRNNISLLSFFLAIKKTQDFTTYNFKHNSPAIQIIPITEQNYTIKNSIVNREEFERMHTALSIGVTDINSGFAVKKLSKCPFHNKD